MTEEEEDEAADNYVAFVDALDVPVEHDAPFESRSAYIDGVEWGAGWVFALIGMALTIRERFCCRACGSWEGRVRFQRCHCENDE